METTDKSRQPLDAAGTKAPLVLESVSPSSLLDEVIRRVAERDDLERRAIKAERERDEARAASEQLAQWWIDQFAKATGWPATSSPHDPMLVKARAEALVKQRDDWMCAADAFESEAFRARAEVAAEKRVREQVTAERDEANARIKELEHQGDRRHERILAKEVATLRGQLANMTASRDEAIRQRDRLMHTNLEGWHLLSVAAQRMLATLKGADVDGAVTLDPRELAVMLDCEQRNVADLIRGARVRETWQERVREEVRAAVDRTLQVKP
jgi:hypothetical protein